MKIDLTKGAVVPFLQSAAMSVILEQAATDIADALPSMSTHDREPLVSVERHDAKLSAAASVTIIHPGAEAIEAKYGYLRKAGRAAGFKVS